MPTARRLKTLTVRPFAGAGWGKRLCDKPRRVRHFAQFVLAGGRGAVMRVYHSQPAPHAPARNWPGGKCNLKRSKSLQSASDAYVFLHVLDGAPEETEAREGALFT